MNENVEPSQNLNSDPAKNENIRADEVQPPVRSVSYWLKRFLACNPFYLVSAALLLFGFYRISVDPGFLSRPRSRALGKSAQVGQK